LFRKIFKLSRTSSADLEKDLLTELECFYLQHSRDNVILNQWKALKPFVVATKLKLKKQSISFSQWVSILHRLKLNLMNIGLESLAKDIAKLYAHNEAQRYNQGPCPSNLQQQLLGQLEAVHRAVEAFFRLNPSAIVSPVLESAPSATAQKHYKILFVDDDKVFRTACEQLTGIGFDVRYAEDRVGLLTEIELGEQFDFYMFDKYLGLDCGIKAMKMAVKKGVDPKKCFILTGASNADIEEMKNKHDPLILNVINKPTSLNGFIQLGEDLKTLVQQPKLEATP
jgi:CheY-like chemotaxis protein